LEEVSRDNQLDAPKRSPAVSDALRDAFELIEEIAIHHGDLIHHEHLGPRPSISGLLVSFYLRDQFIDRLLAQANAAKAVQGHAPDVAGGKTGRGGHRHSIWLFSIFSTKARDDLSK
jgi:hypothetical protein